MVDRRSRPVVPLENPNDREHRRQLAYRANAAVPKDGSERMTHPFPLKTFATAELTGDFAASLWSGATVYDSDLDLPKFSDGTNWNSLALDSDVTTLQTDVSTLQTDVNALEATAIVVLATGSISNQANLSLPLDIYTGYSVFKLYVFNVIPATDNAQPYLRFSDDGGSTFEADAADYQWAFNANSDANVDNDAGDASDAQIILSGGIGNAAGEQGAFEITILNPASSARTQAFWVGTAVNGSTSLVATQGSGSTLVAAVSTDFRFVMSAGNVTLGYRLVGIP